MATTTAHGAAVRIGELAARSGVTPDTPRYYERLGLLPAPRRSASGYRLYGPAALDRLRFIKQAQGLGLSLREIRDPVDWADRGGLKRCERVRALLRRKLADLDAKLTELETFRRTLAAQLERCERTLAASSSAGCPAV
ncbi:MAG TPA: heavy metal-responsive transcriptional regulator [Vicinamibacterales bacterium]|nr:heavy metal-responsive transcriptional regulator [Vicinamibacterales bacterium]